MYKKHLTYLILFCLKNFFNLDKEISLSLVIVVLLILGAVRIKFQQMGLKANAIGIRCREVIYAYKEQYLSGHTEQNIAVPVQHQWRSYIKKDIWHWQLHRS